MIAESPPDDGGDVSARRFFYAADRLSHDNLFRGVVEAMYGTTKDDLRRTGKRPWLERLQRDGFFLIDLAPSPVNKKKTGRRKVLREAVPSCVARSAALSPEGVVVVKVNLYKLLAGPITAAGLRVLQDRPIAFPLGNTRDDFIIEFNRARSRLSK